MSKTLYKCLFKLVGASKIYQQVVVEDRLKNIRPQIRQDIQKLLTDVNQNNPYFKGKFSEFLEANSNSDDDTFFAAYSKLPSFSKQDYAAAGTSVMPDKFADVDPKEMELKVRGKPFEAINRLRKGNYLMPMATGGSSSLPLVVYMTCLLYTSPSPRDRTRSRMPSSA